MDSVADDPDEAILGDTISVARNDAENIHRILSHQAFSEGDAVLFAKQELETLQKVCARFGAVSTKDIEEASYLEAPWRNTNELEKIPYTLAAEDSDCLVEREDIELLSAVS